jgi:tetratricopeptide (TPR) repeat protein
MASAPNPRWPHDLMQAALALHDNRLDVAERRLKAYLKQDPFDARAVRMLAELAGRIGRYRDAETLLRRAVELAPGFTAARANLALVLYRQNRAPEALALLDAVIADEPDNPGHANLKAAALGRLGGFADAILLYEQILRDAPQQPRVWLSYGHMLKTVGRRDEGIAAYRRALSLQPTLGDAWWSLANLKTVRFDDKDISAMEAALAQDAIGVEDRFHIDFALGKAFEDRRDPARSFNHYQAGNALRRTQILYDADETSAFVDRSIAMATPEFLAARQGQGCDAPDPIFVLGMPRAGSTLIEQILASHSLVEGTTELPDMPALARTINGYPDGVAALSAETLRAIGDDYLRRAAIQRRTDRPFFIDKLPNNWAHVPLILLALPRARIIDARRDPLDCCFSNYKQHYARGQAFSYALDDLGRYYRDYVRLMAHINIVLPGRVHRVDHAAMIGDTENTVRALLAACDLDYEPACLAFHETERAVRTASSEQVRRPINRDGVDAWRPYQAWLGPLRSALGTLVDP